MSLENVLPNDRRGKHVLKQYDSLDDAASGTDVKNNTE